MLQLPFPDRSAGHHVWCGSRSNLADEMPSGCGIPPGHYSSSSTNRSARRGPGGVREPQNGRSSSNSASPTTSTLSLPLYVRERRTSQFETDPPVKDYDNPEDHLDNGSSVIRSLELYSTRMKMSS